MKHTRVLVPLLFVLTAIWPLFMHMDTLPIRIWDEARQAVSSLEMLDSGNWLVTQYNGAPEMWSTKPPMLIWLQAFCTSLLGKGEVAVRLPSAMAALLTGWFLLRSTTLRLHAPWLGLIAALIMYTSDGYIHNHVARTGDYDTLLILFMSTGAWTLFRWCGSDEPRQLIWFFLLLAFGVLTKSIQGLTFLPGLGLYLILRGRFVALFKQRTLYLGLGLFVLLVGGFYLARESVNPGYLAAVWENDINARYGGLAPEHDRHWSFYTRMLIEHHFTPWWVLVPVGVAMGLLARDNPLRRWSQLLTCLATTYLLLISNGHTQLEWYSAPLFPVISSLAAIPLYLLLQWTFTENWSISVLRHRVLPWALLFLTFVMPYAHVVGRTYFPKEFPWDEHLYVIPYHFKKALRTGRLECDVYCQESYDAHIFYYAKRLQARGMEMRRVDKEDLGPGMRAVVSEDEVRDGIERAYEHQVLLDEGRLKIYRIIGPRVPDAGDVPPAER